MSFLLWTTYVVLLAATVLAWRNGSLWVFAYGLAAALIPVIALDLVVNSLFIILVGLPIALLVGLYLHQKYRFSQERALDAQNSARYDAMEAK